MESVRRVPLAKKTPGPNWSPISKKSLGSVIPKKLQKLVLGSAKAVEIRRS